MVHAEPLLDGVVVVLTIAHLAKVAVAFRKMLVAEELTRSVVDEVLVGM
jgi:hypothetical protein